MAEHHCELPEPAGYALGVLDAGHDDWRDFTWCDPACGRWWYLDEDTCGECGRSDGPAWRRQSAPRQGPDLPDGEHWRKPPPPQPLFPLVSAMRGGITFGGPPPPPRDDYGLLSDPWVERDAAIRASYADRAAAFASEGRPITATYGTSETDHAIVGAGGWCAPSETVYRIAP